MSRESFVVGCMRRLREYGEGIILADQCISSLKDVVKNNTYTIVGMSQTGQRDRREMVSVLGLNSQQAAIVNFLDVGQGIVRLAGRYPFPQWLMIPLVKPENISEKELDFVNSHDRRLLSLLDQVKFRTNQEEDKRLLPVKSQVNSGSKKESNSQDGIPENVIDMLNDIFHRFDVASTKRAKDFGLSASAANKIFKYIEKEQLVETVKLNLAGGRGGTSKYFVLTNPKGYEAISKSPTKRPGGVGDMHFFIQRYLKKHLAEKGFGELEIEKNIGGKRIDLFGRYGDLKIGVEVCVSTVRTESINIQKDEGKCDILIIVTPDKKTKIKLDKELRKQTHPGNNVKTCVVSKILNKPQEIINAF